MKKYFVEININNKPIATIASFPKKSLAEEYAHKITEKLIYHKREEVEQ